MNAIELLETQPRDVDELFARLEQDGRGHERRKSFDALTDLLAIHASIEELHFYPTVKKAARRQKTEEQLEHSLEEHLGIKRRLALAMVTRIDSRDFGRRLNELKDEVQHHVKEERESLFPTVRSLLDGDQLEALGQEMISTMAELRKGHPRRDVPLQTIARMPLMDPPPAQSGLGSPIFPRIGRLVALPTEIFGAAKMIKSAVGGFVHGVQRGLGGKRHAS